MKAGFASRIISPEQPVKMAGFDRRSEPSCGILDQLHLRILALEGEAKSAFMLCSFDLLGTDSAFCGRIRNCISAATGLTPEQIWVSATHTHSAPSSHFSGNSFDLNYVEKLEQLAVEASLEALNDLRPCELSAAYTEVTGVCSRRNLGREGAATYGMPLLQLRFKRSEGNDISLIRIACHPTILDEKNLLISADLPGSANPTGENMLFFNGACADLSTRFTRRASDVSELKRIAELLHLGIEANKKELKAVSSASLACAEETISLSRSGGIDGEERDALLQQLRKMAAECADPQAWREYDSRIAVLERQNVKPEAARRILVSAVDFSAFALVSLPFEADSADGEEIEALLSEAAGKPVYLFCYTGGYDGYLPSGKPLTAQSSYEDFASRYKPEARNMVWECAKECILRTTGSQH